MNTAVRIQTEDFSQDEEIQALKASSLRIGGIATFLGCARDFSEGRDVTKSVSRPTAAWRWPR